MSCFISRLRVCQKWNNSLDTLYNNTTSSNSSNSNSNNSRSRRKNKSSTSRNKSSRIKNNSSNEKKGKTRHFKAIYSTTLKNISDLQTALRPRGTSRAGCCRRRPWKKNKVKFLLMYYLRTLCQVTLRTSSAVGARPCSRSASCPPSPPPEARRSQQCPQPHRSPQRQGRPRIMGYLVFLGSSNKLIDCFTDWEQRQARKLLLYISGIQKNRF